MNKTAVKNFAIWARNKLIADISYKVGLLGITEKGIKSPLPQSTQTVQFFDIGTKEPSSITGLEIQQRKKLVEEIERKAKQSDYATAYKNVIEEVAYTWFNRLIAIRFMEVNDYLPTRIRVLSSESNGKAEPDLVTHALEASLDYSAYEKDRIIQLKHENKLDELFRMLFIKQCNALNANLPELFEKTSDYTELLLNVSFTDKEGVIYHLVNDIDEGDFNVSKEGQVEIIGWLYQYYNTEPKDETFALLKKNVKITKERIPAATQLFTPDWIVRYMVENSLGRLWLEGHPNDELKENWKYYLDEAQQEDDVQKQLDKIREEYKTIKPEDIKVIDPAMGSGHILVYAFDVLMQIYESYGYSQRDAAKSIVENNLFGLDIDTRAYQLAYFAVMMKARQYNRRILNGETNCHFYAIQESNDINRNQLKYFGAGLSEMEKNTARLQLQGLLDTFTDAKEYGSILSVENYNWELLRKFIKVIDEDGQMSLDTVGIENTRNQLDLLIEIGEVMAREYDVVVTNPPYMGSSGMSEKLLDYAKKNYEYSKSDLFAIFIEKCTTMTRRFGFQAMITQHAFMFLSSFEKLRANIIVNDFINMAHLGARAFEEIAGEVVQTTSFVMRRSNIKNYICPFIRLIDFNNQKIKNDEYFVEKNKFLTVKENFSVIPGKPFAYWVGKNFTVNYDKAKFLSNFAEAMISGNKTANNDVYLRLFWEVESRKVGSKYYLYAKGGKYRKWYGNIEYVIDWSDEAKDAYRNNSSACIVKEQYWFRKGLTYTDLTSKSFSCRLLDNTHLFDMSGPGILINPNMLNYLMGLLNSATASEYLSILSSTFHYKLNELNRVPVLIDNDKKDAVDRLVAVNISISQTDWDAYETSWDFTKHPLRGFGTSMPGMVGASPINTIESAYKGWKEFAESQFIELKANEEELNRIFIDIYGLNDEITPQIVDKDITVARIYDAQEDIPECMKGNGYVLTKTDVIKSFLSYAVGCMFGRYSLDVEGLAYAGGGWDSSNYKSFIPDKDNILPICDDEYFDDDIVGRFVAFVRIVFGASTLEENLKFISSAIGGKGTPREVIRDYFISGFYKDHCKIYQKRPIYWLFDSGKQNGFKALIYMHRYDENTIGNLRIDYLHRIQRIYENEIARMQDTIENSRDAREVTAATKRKEKLIKQLQETKEYDEKIAHLALARTSIDLDDGVKVNYEKIQSDRDGKKLDVLAKI